MNFVRQIFNVLHCCLNSEVYSNVNKIIPLCAERRYQKLVKIIVALTFNFDQCIK